MSRARGGRVFLGRALQLRQKREASILRSFVELLTIPNPINDPEALERNADYLRGAFEQRGLQTSCLRRPGAAPVVHAAYRPPGTGFTLGIYAHYDGQPVDEERWTHPPWKPTLIAGGRVRSLPADGEPVDPEWRIYARSSADDKVSIAALLAALEILEACRIEPTIGLEILLEGEEEIGSPHLGDYLRAERHRLRADAWLVLDGSVHPSGRPQVVLGVRGFQGLQLTVYGPARPLHSGSYGGWAHNPALELARLLGSLQDESGRILVEGFYDSVRETTESERRLLADLPHSDDRLRHELQIGTTLGDGALLAESILQPALNVRGLRSGGVGREARNEIPDRATASLDLRLVPDSRPEEQLGLIEVHLRAQGYLVVRDEPSAEQRRRHSRIVRVERQAGYPAFRISPDHPLVTRVASCIESTDGRAPLLVPAVGGSLPLHPFAEILDTEVVIVPLANHDNGQHGPDENLRLGNLFYGVDLVLALLCGERSI